MNVKIEKRGERELLECARRIDIPTLEVIYDHYSPRLFIYAMRLLGDACQAEDCVAETFSRFLISLRAGQGPREHLQAYLYRVALNWISDQYRRQPPIPLDLDENLREEESAEPETRPAGV